MLYCTINECTNVAKHIMMQERDLISGDGGKLYGKSAALGYLQPREDEVEYVERTPS